MSTIGCSPWIGCGVHAFSMGSHRKVLPGSTTRVPCKVMFNLPMFTPPEFALPTSGQLPFAHSLSVHVLELSLVPKRLNSLDGPPASTLASRVAPKFQLSSIVHFTSRLIFPCRSF